MNLESAAFRRTQGESIVVMKLNACNCRNDPCASSKVGFDSFFSNYQNQTGSFFKCGIT